MTLEHTHAQPIEKVFSAVGSSPKGIVPQEAQRRLTLYGPNSLVEEKRFKSLKLLAAQFKNLFIPLLLVAAVLSFLFESSVNGIVLLLVAGLNVGVSFVQERKTEKTLEALRAIHPTKAEVIRGGESIKVPVEEIVIGDVVVLREGTAVPADIRLFEVRDLKVDEAVLTGESIPSTKVVGVLPKTTPLADQENMAYSGTMVVSGIGKGVVVQTGLATEFGRIASFVQVQEERSLLLERIAHLSVWLVAISAALSALVLVLGIIREHEIVHALNFAIALFVSAVPESLPTITTLALAMTALRLSARKALVRHLPTVEALSGINLFAFDKTGTITQNEMMVAKIVFPDRELEVTGSGFSSEGEVLYQGTHVHIDDDSQLREFIEIGVRSTTATISPVDDAGAKRWAVHGDPTEGAFLILARKVGLPDPEESAIKKFAFTSERKMCTGVFFKDAELRVYSVGAPEVILPLCRHYLQGGKAIELSPARRVYFEGQANKLATDGYRVLALAFKRQGTRSIVSREVEKDLTFVGFGGLLDKPKPRVAETFATLREAGIKPVIITGDHPGTASAVARELGLKFSAREVLTGPQLDKMTDEALLAVVPRVTVFARITPTQKYRIVEAFKRFGLRVAVSGDGVNDAPALKKADVGVVMGKKGTDVSKEAADLVILDDKIETVLPAIIEARTLYDNIKKFFTFLLSGNFDELLVISWAFLVGLPQPLTILQVLWLNLVSDTFPAFALAFDSPSVNVLQEAPRELGSRMIRPVIVRAFLYGLLGLICSTLIFLFYLPDVAKARTVLFTQVIFFELAIIFSIRSGNNPFWKGFLENRYLLISFVISVLLQVLLICTPFASSFFGTTFLSLYDWGVVVAVVGGAFAVAEIAKWLWRRTHR